MITLLVEQQEDLGRRYRDCTRTWRITLVTNIDIYTQR